MSDLLESVAVGAGLALLLLPIHLGVVWFRKKRGDSNAAALRFAGVGAASVVAFVVALGALNSVVGSESGEDCPFDGSTQVVDLPDGGTASICVVGSTP